MKVLVTGAFGQVGRAAVHELVKAGHEVTAFDVSSPGNRRTARRFGVITFWGDLRDAGAVLEAVKGKDAVIHLGAIIPPLADTKPDLAQSVNVGGTENVIAAIKADGGSARLIFTSSIAVYGDRLASPFIGMSDSPEPNHDDAYGLQKVRCEALVRDSGLTWCIFRLSYIVSPEALKLIPLMFEMPLSTRLELCHARDAASALCSGISSAGIWGKTLLIAGGEACRTTYAEYLMKMFSVFGLGKRPLPSYMFRERGFHCAWMDTSESQSLLGYQRCTLEEFLEEVRLRYRFRSFFLSFIRPVARLVLASKSPRSGRKIVPRLNPGVS